MVWKTLIEFLIFEKGVRKSRWEWKGVKDSSFSVLNGVYLMSGQLKIIMTMLKSSIYK